MGPWPRTGTGCTAAVFAGLLCIASGTAAAMDGPVTVPITVKGRSAASHKADARADIRIDPLPEPGTALPPNLGRLSAAHAVLTGSGAAASASAVNRLYTYQQAKAQALAMPAATADQQQARAAALGRADALLELLANRPVSARVVADVDALLGLDRGAQARNGTP